MYIFGTENRIDFLRTVAWYASTTLSAICSKLYLSSGGNSFTLSLLSFAFGGVGSFWGPSKSSLLVSIPSSELYGLALLHVATTLMTNMSLQRASVAFTYLLKALEPLFTAAICRHALQDKPAAQVYFSLITIFVGVAITTAADIDLSVLTILPVLVANLASCSRNLMFKSTLNEASENWMSIYSQICIRSFIILAPFTLLHFFFNIDGNISKTLDSELWDSIIWLVPGAFFHFLYTLCSLFFLERLSPVSHAIANFMRRVATIYCSILYFRTPMIAQQLYGFVLTGLGVGWYTYIKSKKLNGTSSIDSPFLKPNYPSKKRYVLLVAFITTLAVLLDIGYLMGSKRSDDSLTSDVPTIPKRMSAFDHSQRRECLRKIKEQTLNIMRPQLPYENNYVLIDLALHVNIGDNFLSLGELHLLHALDLRLVAACIVDSGRSCSVEKMEQLIESNHTILWHAGGNWGSLYPSMHTIRMDMIKKYPNARIISMPQSLLYKDDAILQRDVEVVQASENLTMTWRSMDSFNYAREKFPRAHSLYVPDMAFLIGDEIPNAEPTVDIVFLLRMDVEGVNNNKWAAAISHLDTLNITHTSVDWRPSQHGGGIDVGDILVNRLHTGNRLLSQGRVVVTDRLHGTIMSTLLGKPHVFLDNSYKKITETRTAAFVDKPECSDENLRADFAAEPMQAIELAVQRLKTL